jgi:RHS repeat-associated protein
MKYAIALFIGVSLVLAGGVYLVQTKAGDDFSWAITYDTAGRIIKISDPAGRGTKVTYQSDENNRIRRQVVEAPGDPIISYDFDSLGRRAAMTDGAGNVRYEYDSFGRLERVHRERMPSITYSYDTLGRLISLGLGPGFKIDYIYDFLGRIAEIHSPSGRISYDYQAGQGMIIRTLPNGIRTVWDFQPNGALNSISHIASDNTLLVQFKYFYRPDDLLSRVEELSSGSKRSISYEYDAVQRLIAVRDSRGGETRFTYDKLGNRTRLETQGQPAVDSAYDWVGRLLRHNGQAAVHDAAGNLISYTRLEGPKTFEYNGANLLKIASTQMGKVEYGYDGDGNLISRACDGKRTSYVSDPLADIWRPLMEIDAKAEQTFYIWEGDTLLATVTNGECKYVLQDHLGSVRSVVNEGGGSTQSSYYGPFGTPQQEFAGMRLQSGFAGLFFDPVASVYLTRARAFDPVIGRFLQRDPKLIAPFLSQEGLSAYVYCGDDPVNYVDLDGARRKWVWGPENWAWQVLRRPLDLMDRTYAKQWYARQSEVAISSARGTGFSAGLQATALDLIGGYIPGKAANEGQRYAQALWSLAPIGSLGILGKSEALKGLGIGRTFISSLLNSKDRKYLDSALDIVSLGGSAMGIRADSMGPKIIMEPSGQYAWDLDALPGIAKSAKTLKTTSQIISLFNQFRKIHNELKNWNSSDASPMSPSNVGGVYLNGAGDSLKNLGPLKGVAFDQETGRLVLIAEDRREIGLPPLRLDDVVTVFRSVYEYGSSPSVTIDPNPSDPEGPFMLVRHGEGTADTFVGWILFESDRVMKAYSLGYDNVTKQPLKSAIAGYQNLFDMGFSSFDGGQKEPIWERFWIVPDAVNRRQSKKGDLTLLDVSLKVNTQRMILRNGNLVPVPGSKSSPQAEQFAQWFTDNYDKIAAESHSLPPKESGLNAAVAFFAELRRIALIAAMAEALRDQGVPMPGWMRDYHIEPVPVTATTPAIVVEASESDTRHVVEGQYIKTITSERKRRIYGGVTLTPSDKDVHVMAAAPEADALSPELWKSISAARLLSPVTLETNGTRYKAVALPGDNTLDLAPARLVQTDLAVPIQQGSEIKLSRQFHSFFQPSDFFGKGWTMDLPRLEQYRRPIRNNGNETRFQVCRRLTSPLNNYSAEFTETQFVPEVSAKLLIPQNSDEILGLSLGQDKRIGIPTHIVLFRDGRKWHFDQEGRLVAIEERPQTTIYRWDAAQRIRRIEGWYGNDLRADIRLEYDNLNRLSSAQGSKGGSVKYSYNSEGFLYQTDGPEGVAEYHYHDNLVTRVLRNSRLVHEFGYTDRGRLLRERNGNGTEIAYSLSSEDGGVKITASRSDRPEATVMAKYDAAFRPLSRAFPDGSRINWRYGGSGAAEATITVPGQEPYIVNRSADGRHLVWRLPEGGVYSCQYDAAGRLTALIEGNRPVLLQRWMPDGRLASAEYENFAIRPNYRDDGIPGGFLLTAREAGPRFSRWLSAQVDTLGRVVNVNDYSGAEIKIGYDKTGQPAILVSNRGGTQINRDDRGWVETIQTSWGDRQDTKYDPKNGSIQKIEIMRGNSKALIEFEEGRPIKIHQFDGGEANIVYHLNGQHKGFVREVRTPNGLVLTYEYNSENRIVAVNCGSAYRLQYSYDSEGRLIRIKQVQSKA